MSRRQMIPTFRGYRWIVAAIIVLCILSPARLFFSLNSTYIPHLPHISTSHPSDLDTRSVGGSPARFAEKVADGRVLVTGGGGYIGKHLIRSLLSSSTPVSVVDLIFQENELKEIHDDIPDARALLRVITGDIRDKDVLRDAMTSDVVGVVHLAAVSRVMWCLENEPDCMDVNQRGATVVLDTLREFGSRTGRRLWFVMSSSRDVYGASQLFAPTEHSEARPTHPFGRSMLAAERALNEHLEALKGAGQAGALTSIVLRLSTVYGGRYDHIDRFIPSVTSQALQNMPIQLAGGDQVLDLVHIDDCVDAFLLAIKRLTARKRSWSILQQPTFLETYNVASGSAISANAILDKVLRMTRSKSPIQRLEEDDRFRDQYAVSTERAAESLGYRATVSVDDGLMRVVRSHLERSEKFLRDEIRDTCHDAASALHDNSRLATLDGCSVHVTVDIQGRLGSLISQNRQWVVLDHLPPPTLKTTVNQTEDGRWLLRLRHPYGAYFGIRGTPNESGGEAQVHPEVTPKDLEAAAAGVDWELEVNVEKAAVKFIVPDSAFQLIPPSIFGGKLTYGSRDLDVWPFRITPICCPGPSPWAFFSEDPIDNSIDYTRTSPAVYFAGSGPKTVCSRLERALEKAQQDYHMLSSAYAEQQPRNRYQLGRGPEWVNANLPACTNMCSHPAVCIDTGDCQCTLSTCPTPERFPFASFAQSTDVSYPPFDPPYDLLQLVEESSWLSLLRPQAARLISSGTPWPNVHVSPMSPHGEAWKNNEDNDFDLLRDAHCFSADSSMEYALAPISVPPEEAEIVFMPFYDFRGSALFDNTWEHISKTISNFDPHKLIIPFAYDWGACRENTMYVWNIRRKPASRSPRANAAVAWSVMGDLNSPCYKPFQDVVIPPRTCESESLMDSFGDMSKVRPARDRRLLSFFRGTWWGTGVVTRQKVMCNRVHSLSPPPKRLVTSKPLKTLWGTYGNYGSYVAVLNDTIFCMQVEGTAGWAPRLSDSIYAGCIPVFIGGSTEYPFYDVIDWSKISIRVERKDLQRLEEVLLQYTIEEVERLQANVLLIRDAFIYPLDGDHEDQFRMRGPLYFAMYSTRMRLLTQYPVEEVMDRPDWQSFM